MITRKVKAIQTSTICTKKCWNACTSLCRCSCGGKNHGVGEQNIMLVDSVPVVKHPSQISKKTNISVRCCGAIKSFTFTDGKIIKMCPTHSGRTNHHSNEFNSTRNIDVQRRAILCGGAR